MSNSEFISKFKSPRSNCLDGPLWSLHLDVPSYKKEPINNVKFIDHILHLPFYKVSLSISLSISIKVEVCARFRCINNKRPIRVRIPDCQSVDLRKI